MYSINYIRMDLWLGASTFPFISQRLSFSNCCESQNAEEGNNAQSFHFNISTAGQFLGVFLDELVHLSLPHLDPWISAETQCPLDPWISPETLTLVSPQSVPGCAPRRARSRLSLSPLDPWISPETQSPPLDPWISPETISSRPMDFPRDTLVSPQSVPGCVPRRARSPLSSSSRPMDFPRDTISSRPMDFPRDTYSCISSVSSWVCSSTSSFTSLFLL
ncbi:hypothetical protein TNCT_588691 [Trichonephila clavata]|uniref:Uncharacterized protein n=1 Tax=Trichonephila clavata TaxID=2740835 RepID=A0A8X6GWX2_TRICU|nr:hypothetical protein TNCT_588691 [Trichonephila clavata]